MQTSKSSESEKLQAWDAEKGLDYLINSTAKNARPLSPPINVTDEAAWKNDMQRHTLAQLFQLALSLSLSLSLSLDAYWKTFIKISARRAVIREIADRAVNFQGAIFYLHFRWSARCGDERENQPRALGSQSRNCISRAEIKPQPPRLVVLGRRDKKGNQPAHTHADVTLKAQGSRECVKYSISNAYPLVTRLIHSRALSFMRVRERLL